VTPASAFPSDASVIGLPAEMACLEIAPGDMSALWPAAGRCSLMHGSLVYGSLMYAPLLHGPLVHGPLVHRPRSGVYGPRGRMGWGLCPSFWRRTIRLGLRGQRKHGHKRYQSKHYRGASGRSDFHVTPH
jgi:hypothetical protein